MIDIWNYEYRDKIKIVCTDDSVFEGIVSDISDASECSDLGYTLQKMRVRLQAIALTALYLV